MNDKSRKAMFAKFLQDNGKGVSLMTGDQAEKHYQGKQASSHKIVNDYNTAHDVIEKMRKKDYSNISKGEYVRKVRRYHNTINKYEKVFGTKPNNVIKMS